MKHVAIAFFLILSVVAGSPAMALDPGVDAPPFTLLSPSTQTQVKFPDLLEGKGGLLVFFNTACAACESELIAAKVFLESNPNAFRLVAVAIDQTSDARARVTKFVEEKGIGSVATILLDPKFEVAEKYGFTFTPASVGVKGGKIVFSLNGFSRAEAKGFSANLEKLK